MADFCPHCGESLGPQVNRPEGCQCNNLEWRDPYNLPPVCDHFYGDVGGSCRNCEHDEECHATSVGEINSVSGAELGDTDKGD